MTDTFEPVAHLAEALDGPVTRWIRTLRDCRLTTDQAAAALHRAVDVAAARIDNPNQETT